MLMKQKEYTIWPTLIIYIFLSIISMKVFNLWGARTIVELKKFGREKEEKTNLSL